MISLWVQWVGEVYGRENCKTEYVKILRPLCRVLFMLENYGF